MNQMGAHILAQPTVSLCLHRFQDGCADQCEAKQCYHCQGLGHVQADCPTLRISGAGTGGGRCYSCGQPGHLAVRTSASRIPSFSLTESDSGLAQMQAFNPDLHSVLVGGLFLLVEDSPVIFAGDLPEELVVHALLHATSVVDQITMPVTVKRKP